MTSKPRTSTLLSIICLATLAASTGRGASAQDLLRRGAQAPNPLANIQLPPQLASLTPDQLRQLAQLRELQIQQQRQQAGSQPPTTQPTETSSTQIAQPNSAASTTSNAPAENERHDDGSYTESGTEMEGVSLGSGEPSAGPASGSGASGEPNSTAPAAPNFEVNWNKCPQLEPSEQEKSKKTQVITKCLQSAPIPTNLTSENVESHREQIATCALKVEGWFDETGNYRYEKAEAEIRGKRLEPSIEVQVLKFHVACKEEAGKKFPREKNTLIDQVQFYQACMDYYISIVCEIEVSVDQ